MWRPGYVEDAGEVDAGVAGVDDDELESLDEELPEPDELEEPESLDGVVGRGRARRLRARSAAAAVGLVEPGPLEADADGAEDLAGRPGSSGTTVEGILGEGDQRISNS